MAVHSFSTRTKKPQDELVVQELKHYYQQRHVNFSGVILDLLTKHHQELLSDKV